MATKKVTTIYCLIGDKEGAVPMTELKDPDTRRQALRICNEEMEVANG